MAKWARKNLEGQIVEIIDFDPTDKFHSDVVWEQVSDSATVFVVQTSEPSPAPTGPALTEEEKAADAIARAEANARVNAWRAEQGLPPIEN